MRIHTIFPAEFPEPWASDWGEDDYGIFMGFTYKGVRQDFRWIEPGTFLMGSPEKERGREDVETQHEVTLTNGFWLADTTVTQALWEAVMGTNPSRFNGTNRPVENVCWNDAQTFISKMNGMRAELQLCLPTEAQWEYACRAGTTTRYAFGNTLNKKQANFGASETIDVASYLPSSWGLYDMHGGVYEWCQDLSKYDITKSVVDPQGGTLGINRVFRGGSWNSSSGDCSSYHRDFGHPAYCDRLTSGNRSFRLARSL